MKDLRATDDEQLISETMLAVKNERSSTAEVVRHFQEIVDRKLYLKRGYPSMFEMVTKFYGYCNCSAQRRINSMRLVKDLPEVASKLESGELSLSAAATVQTFFYAEKKDNKAYSKTEKLEVVQACLKKSTREVERELAKRNPEIAKKEFSRAINDEQLRVSFTITNELDAKLTRLKNLMSHRNPNMKMDELLDRLAEIALDKLDPVRKAKRSLTKTRTKPSALGIDDARFAEPALHTTILSSPPKAASEAKTNLLPAQEVKAISAAAKPELQNRLQRTTSFATPKGCAHHKSSSRHTRYVTARTRAMLWSDHDGKGCEFVAPLAKRRCGSQHLIQIEHRVPHAHGGSNERANLMILCAEHNRLAWTQASARANDLTAAGARTGIRPSV